MDAHRGQLFVEGNRAGLDAGITIDRKHCYVASGDDTWTFARRDVTARRWQGNDFKLTLAGESFVFTSADPLRFTFEVVDELDSGGSRRRPKGRKSARVEHRTRPPRAQKPAAAVPGSPSDKVNVIWTDLAGGRDASTLLEALAELNAGDHHQHTLEPGDEAGDGVVQICAECRQVFIDLISAEEPERRDPWIELR